MKKLRQLPEESFLKLFYWVFALSFLLAVPFMPDRNNLLPGCLQILIQPCKVPTSYFAVGGFAATFFNMGLVGLFCAGLYTFLRAEVGGPETLSVILTTGFGAWGINLVNMLPGMLGVILHCLIKKERFRDNAQSFIFSTGLAPLMTDLVMRYPNDRIVGFQPIGFALALAVGVFIGFFLPAGIRHSPDTHRGYSIYSAAFPMGMMAFFLNATLFRTMGISVPPAPPAESLLLASPVIVNTFCGILFGTAIVLAFWLGCRPRDYWALMADPDLVTCVSGGYGNAVFLMNFGVFGLFILGYYNLIGATFNGVTFGVVFCMLSTCNGGSHPGNVWPIMLGYVGMSALFGVLSKLAGGEFAMYINAQSIVVGLCYANGLSPIADRFGWKYGVLAAGMHFLLVTSVPDLHGGFCLYNGGFTAVLICIILVPTLERFTRAGKRELTKA